VQGLGELHATGFSFNINYDTRTISHHIPRLNQHVGSVDGTSC